MPFCAGTRSGQVAVAAVSVVVFSSLSGLLRLKQKLVALLIAPATATNVFVLDRFCGLQCSCCSWKRQYVRVPRRLFFTALPPQVLIKMDRLARITTLAANRAPKSVEFLDQTQNVCALFHGCVVYALLRQPHGCEQVQSTTVMKQAVLMQCAVHVSSLRLSCNPSFPSSV